MIARRLALFVPALFVMHLHAEKPFDFQSTPGKLPKQVVPTEYTIRIVPNVAAKTFAGNTIIKVKVNEPVRQLILNARELDVTGAIVDDESLPQPAVKLDQKQQLLTINLP